MSSTVLKILMYLLFVTNFTVRNPYSRNIFKSRYFDRVFTGCFSVCSVKVFILWSSPQYLHNWLFQVFLQGFQHFLSSRSSGSYTPWILGCKEDTLSSVPLEQDLFHLLWPHKRTNSSQKKLHQKSTCHPEQKVSQKPLRFSSELCPTGTWVHVVIILPKALQEHGGSYRVVSVKLQLRCSLLFTREETRRKKRNKKVFLHKEGMRASVKDGRSILSSH